MRVVLLGTAWPYRGGLATFNERLAQQFMEEGHEVEIFTFTLQYPSFLFPGKSQFANEEKSPLVKITRKINSCNPFNWISVGRELKKMTPDLIISCYWMAFFAPCYTMIQKIAKKNGKTKCMSLVHNMTPHEPSIIDKIFTPFFVKNTDGFVALSDSVVKDIAKIDTNNKPKDFSPHPIYDHYGKKLSKDEACRNLNLDTQKSYMLFFGLVRAYKGLDLLIDAFSKISNSLPNLQLIIAGEFYEDEEKYIKQIKTNNLTDRVIIKNEFIADNELANYFGAADLVVQPYKSATQSGVTQVAFHFEKPMLVTNVGGLGEVVHHGKMGYAAEPNSTAISDCIKDFFEQNRKEDFTNYLCAEKNKYGWDKMTATFFETLRKIK